MSDGEARALLERLEKGERAALARAISLVENLAPGFELLLHQIHGRLGRAARIGLTGPPGAGKSTLAAQLAAVWRGAGETVGIIAVDPTSPFSGGALLGDRVRMNPLSTDPGVFVRSMASRGSLGGLATTTGEVGDLLDAFGFDRVLTETVGVGQSELDIAGSAETTVVVLVPESGDSVQAMKAGLMEIADIFVINKADRPGAERLARDVELMLHLRRTHLPMNEVEEAGTEPEATVVSPTGSGGAGDGAPSDWRVPVLLTAAETGEGVTELARALDDHRGYLDRTGELVHRRRRRYADRTRAAVERELRRAAWNRGAGETILTESLPALESGSESPYSVAARIVRELGVRT